MSVPKEVTVNGRRYQISKMTPLVACRIHNWIVSGQAKMAMQMAEYMPEEIPEKDESAISKLTPEERADGAVVSTWNMASTAWSEELIEKIQMHCLKAVLSYPDEADGPPAPVMSSDGRWADRRLQDDTQAVDQLIREALKFNVSPFFTGNQSNQAGA